MTKAIAFSPEDVLKQLKAGASPRKQRSLDLIHTICKEQEAASSTDFSVVTIGQISASRGGPSVQPIRNKAGEPYRTLLAAWANAVGTSTRKPASAKGPSFSDDLLEMIADPSIRVLVGSIMAEVRKLKKENGLLKNMKEMVIDCRKLPDRPATRETVVQTKPDFGLAPFEIEALKQVWDEAFLSRMGWTIDPTTGRIKKGTQPIFRPGFATAISKILSQCGESTFTSNKG